MNEEEGGRGDKSSDNETKRKVVNIEMTPLQGYPLRAQVVQHHFEIVTMFRGGKITYLLTLRNAVGNKSAQHSR